MVGYTDDGRPLETYIGPFSLRPGEKKVFLTSELPVRPIEKNDLFGIKIMAPSALGVVNLMGYYQRNMSCYGTTSQRDWMAVPDTVTPGNNGKSVSWGIYNPAAVAVNARMQLFSGQGVLLDEVDLGLAANRAMHYNKTSSPFVTHADNGWIRVETDGADGLTGYVEWLEKGISKAEALNLPGYGTELVIPHVIHTDLWETRLSLINASGTANTAMLSLVNGSALQTQPVSFGPHEKQSIDLNELFGELSISDFNRSAVLIQSDGPLTGFYCYDTPADYLCYPLLGPEQIQDDFILPHIASGDGWWTGINLFNPSGSVSIAVQIQPYDQNGNLLGSAAQSRTLTPWKKEIFTIGALFPSIAPKIAYIKIRTSNGSGLIGTYGIGNPDCSMLSGSILQ